MTTFSRLGILLLFATVLVGCGNDGGVVATDDEIKAHVEKHGDLKLDPAASSPLTD